MQIRQSNIRDIEDIFNLYRLATQYQKTKFPGNIWPEFEASLVVREIKENRQFKIVINNDIACIWAITFSDPLIWEEKDKDPAVYIHRIATNSSFRGQNFVKQIVSWAKMYAFKHTKHYIRLDTCGNNTSLIKHYTNCGFTFLGKKKLKDTNSLPSHYHNAEVCFFEIKLTRL